MNTRAAPAAAPAAASASASSALEEAWPWYTGGLVVGAGLIWAILYLARVGEGFGAARVHVIRALLAVIGGLALVAIVYAFDCIRRRNRKRVAELAKMHGVRAARSKQRQRGPSIMAGEVGVDHEEPVPRNTEGDIEDLPVTLPPHRKVRSMAAGQSDEGEEGEEGEEGDGEEGDGEEGEEGEAGEGGEAGGPDHAAAPTEADMDAAHDYAASLAELEEASSTAMVGGVRSSSFATRVRPRQLEAAKRYVSGGKDLAEATDIAEAISYEGMRRAEESTLFARESYKTHQYDEPGEGFVGGYVEPTLDSYDMAFQAYSDSTFIPRRQRLSGNAPMHF